MNAQQRQELLVKISEIAGEHCNAFVFIADVEKDEYVEGDHESVMISSWDGGITMAMGLLRRMQLHMETDEADQYRQRRDSE